MAGGVVVLTDEVGSTTEERVGTGGVDDTPGISLLTGQAALKAEMVSS